jgi:hypothetical protein
MCDGQEGDTGPPRDTLRGTVLPARPENGEKFPAKSRYENGTTMVRLFKNEYVDGTETSTDLVRKQVERTTCRLRRATTGYE